MSSLFFPFRPNLQGEFAARFALKARDVVEHGALLEAVTLEEFQWATDVCVVNPSQRRFYRAAWLLWRDLGRVGWTARWNNQTLELCEPSHKDASGEIPGSQSDQTQIKATMRKAMQTARLAKMLQSRDFILSMEKPPRLVAKSSHSITSLFADGEALARDLRQVEQHPVEQRAAALEEIVSPYLQLVEEGMRCQFTGLRLGDVWRYLRFLWTTPAESTPGRTMLYLVRDAARPFHPIMGIASLENAPLRIASRDRFLGWSAEGFRNGIGISASETQVRAAFAHLLSLIEQGLGEIDASSLLSPSQLKDPDDNALHHLAHIVARSHEERADALRRWQTREHDNEEMVRSELGNISVESETLLYRRKRADALGKLLAAKRELTRWTNTEQFENWFSFASSDRGESAIRNALLPLKNRHIGTSLLELNVCGAIPPYNPILGGKLVALLMLSPQIAHDYQARYGGRASDIASRMKGEDVVRPAQITFLGTTSLYHVGSSQYNRLRLPADLRYQGSPEVRWKELDITEGYGTWHISPLTLACLEEVAREGGATIANHVFGEGASPKFRSIRQGLDALFPSGSRYATDKLSRHAMKRIVFGALTQSDSLDVLRGQKQELAPPPVALHVADATDRIAAFWRSRWLSVRLDHEAALHEVEFELRMFWFPKIFWSRPNPRSTPLSSLPAKDFFL